MSIFKNPYILREIIESLTLDDIKTLSRVNKTLGTLLECFRDERIECSLFSDITKSKVLEYLTYWINRLYNYAGLTPQKLTVLQQLHLSCNGLTDIPPELGTLNNLQELYLCHNHLTTLPPELGRLKDLKELHLRDNKLTVVPPELGNLDNLEVLDLWHNNLTTIPPELGNLNNLRILDLDANKLTDFQSDHGIRFAIPPELGRLNNLHLLCLRNNILTDQSKYGCPTIPQELDRDGLIILKGPL